MDADAERGQEALREGARGDARRGLAGAGALEHVADVREAVLLRPGEVGVPGTRQVGLLDLGVDRPGVHPLLPVRVVAVRDQHGDRASERLAVAHARADLDRVGLDLHAPAAAVAELAPGHVAVQRLAVELEARGQALDDRDEARAVRFAGGCEGQFHGASVIGGHDRDRSPDREERRERDRARARRAPVPGDEGEARERPRHQGDQQRRHDRASEEQAEHGRELDVAEAHAVGPRDRGGEQEAPSAGRSGNAFGQGVRRGDQRDRKGSQRRRPRARGRSISLERRSVTVTTASIEASEAPSNAAAISLIAVTDPPSPPSG